ncbi:MAG: 3'-kinase [Phenylobacterium sp.]|uniref:aminoglycoside phosphotransferase family protein n=1 Tax=Phenylobacterium sp. TaxID=1871053 RepID=UPI0025FC07DD|nr:aminoglycoside phosphotransferase family protein [Phenylobacterium sp.]MBA4014395.1 3'-kinase [Phenylobacterium sp.]
MTKPSFQPWLDLWGLTPDGDAFTTEYTGSWLLPVRQADRPAILKLAAVPEEIAGAALMEWWNGQGAAQVLGRQDEALLLERAVGPRSLVEMSRGDQDDDATRIICDAVAVLHAPRGAPPPAGLVPLDVWFAALGPGAANHGGVLVKAYETAQALLAQPRDVVPLHGDVHHANILDFGPRGWLAIDPKGVLGERGYDYANPFCNPDTATALIPGRLDRYLGLVSERAGMDPRRLLMWILAYSGLSAAWILDDGDPAQFDSSIAELAAARLYA